MENKNKVFTDKNFGFYHFANHFLVECPKCFKMAKIVPEVIFSDSSKKERNLVCHHCGYSKIRSPLLSLRLYHDRDWYFQQPLWLQIECCGHTLWAFNLEHLLYIKDFVKAGIRKKTKDNKYGWMNKSLISRLPKWIKSGKNREEILKAIKKLEEKCG